MRRFSFRTATVVLSTLVATIFLSAYSASQEASAPGPKRKDAKAKFQPKQVTFATKVTPATAKPGDVVTYTVDVTIAKGWHIYAVVDKQPGSGPQGTEFDFFNPAGLTVAGDWAAAPAPIAKVEPAFDNQKFSSHSGKVSFSRKLKIPEDAKPGKKTLRSQIYFQTCDEKQCLPPARVTVPDAVLTITGKDSTLAPTPDDRRAALAVSLIASIPSSATAATPKKADGDLGKAIDGGLLAFLLYSALGGLVAVLMPCVWPMIPITVNFFVKQGEKKEGSTTGLAIAYCLSIIGIFTSLGLGVTLLKGGAGVSNLGNNPWMNLLMGIAFILLGMSLLGLFEIRLPSSFLNFSSQGEGKGGLLGVMFMALTLTLTSFTCTAPVVGGLLGQAAQGQRLYPLLGMLVFSSVLALPFFVMALMPGLMKKMPRSGDWMNSVKVVGGLIEIGAAFKFLNTAEISFGTSPADAYFNAAFVVTAWVVVAAVCGVYLLGLFRTTHDHEAVQVGPTRMLIGMAFVGVALMLAPALFGNRPRNKVFDAIVGILPPDADSLDSHDKIVNDVSTRIAGLLPAAGSGSAAPSAAVADRATIFGPVAATSKDPKEAVLQEKKFHGVVWGLSYEAAIAEAKAKNKLVFIDFTGLNCTNCRTVERTIMPRPEVVAELKKFVTVALYNDFVDIASITREQREDLANQNKERQDELANTIATPTYVALSPDGKVLGKVEYSLTDADFLLKFLREMQAKHAAGEKVVAK